MILIIGGAFQGKTKFAEDNFKSVRIFDNFHDFAKQKILEGVSCEEILEETFDFDVIISNETGCGIVPVDKRERFIREETGRMLCVIAKRCDEVWRIQCGIGVKIKG